MSSHATEHAAFLKLIETAELPRLGPQRRPGTAPAAEIRNRVSEFCKQRKVSAQARAYLESAALLWHDHLDESHTISQSLETPEGSWLHGIMHRREPDYGNAKYWFRRVGGQHEAFADLAGKAAELVKNDSKLANRLLDGGTWDSFAFIDECQRVESSGSDAEQTVMRKLQAAEFEVLIGHLLVNP